MSQVLSIFQGCCNFKENFGLHYRRVNSWKLLQHKSYLCCGQFNKCNAIQFSVRDKYELVNHSQLCESQYEDEASDGVELDAIPHVQTLRKFPNEELFRKIVLVRFDSDILLQAKVESWSTSANALSTIKYLHQSGARVILVSSWQGQDESELLAAKDVAELLSSALELKVIPAEIDSGRVDFQLKGLEESVILLLNNLFQLKEELANCSKFAEQLSSIVDIFVNDAFSQSHKVLTSTVGIARFCYASIAGFHFEDRLYQMKKIITIDKSPYFAIIGGGNLVGKAAALRLLASRCDGLVFVGNIAFQIMHVLGLTVPLNLVERGTFKEAHAIVEYAKSRKIPLVLPKDFWCVNDHQQERLKMFPAHSIFKGWQPIDLGPKSLDEITSFLSGCKKITWIGPVKFSSSSEHAHGTSKLGAILNDLSQSNCEITVVGKMACRAVMVKSSSVSSINTIEGASAVWEFLKGRKLPGLMALDRAYPFEIDWSLIYSDPTEPLAVDIGSGNGLFVFRMAKKRNDFNFLGMEINGKLVNRCLAKVHQSGMKNGHFIETNATSTFRSIVSTYPGELLLVSIQCPNPDFNRPEHRWRMLQRSLVEAIADLLTIGGKVFLQSDVEAVAVRMKEEFMRYGKGKLIIDPDIEEGKLHDGEWLKENPFGVRSDWEQHVLDRGAPMYRLLLRKINV